MTKNKLDMQLLRYWSIGAALSLLIVVMSDFSVHTPLQAIAWILSVPLLPGLFLFVEVARASRIGERAMTLGINVSQVLVGSFIYGALVLVIHRMWHRRERSGTDPRRGARKSM